MKNLYTYLLTLVFFCLLLTACETISYLGDTYPVNQNVAVFYDLHDVKRDYKVIGHITCAVTRNEEDAKNTMIGKAKLVGGDAIIFIGLSFTGGKDSTPIEKADVIKYNDEQAAKTTAPAN